MHSRIRFIPMPPVEWTRRSSTRSRWSGGSRLRCSTCGVRVNATCPAQAGLVTLPLQSRGSPASLALDGGGRAWRMGVVRFRHVLAPCMPRLRGLLLTLLTAAMAGPAAAASPPHVVVILVDDMGYGDLRAYNPRSKISTPQLDRLALRACGSPTLTRRGRSAPVALRLMTGRYPFRTDVSRWPTRPLIDEEQVTLPSMLRGPATPQRWSGSGISDSRRTVTRSRYAADRSIAASTASSASAPRPTFLPISTSAATAP